MLEESQGGGEFSFLVQMHSGTKYLQYCVGTESVHYVNSN